MKEIFVNMIFRFELRRRMENVTVWNVKWDRDNLRVWEFVNFVKKRSGKRCEEGNLIFFINNKRFCIYYNSGEIKSTLKQKELEKISYKRISHIKAYTYRNTVFYDVILKGGAAE